MTGMKDPQYAIIQFENLKVNIIRTKWANFNVNGEICSTTFPNVPKKELESLLKVDSASESLWLSESGIPHKVIETFCYAGEFKRFYYNYIYILNISSQYLFNFSSSR